MSVPIAVLKDELSAYLRRVRRGGRLSVTDRGRPIAQLTPLAATPEHAEETALLELESEGVLRRGRGGALPTFRPIRVRGRPVSSTLLDERGPRR